MHMSRLIALAGGHNFRDFGGYPTADGRHVRRGMLFRSGGMAHVDENDIQTLRALGLRTVCDLRTLSERTQQPTSWQDRAVEMLADDDTASTATLHALLADPGATSEAMTTAMIDLYADLPFKHLPMYRLLLRRLAEGRAPLVVNCTAGKDRTGVGVAIVLRALGVSPADVEEDYLASNFTIDLPRLLADSGYVNLQRSQADVVKAMMAVTPAYLQAAFKAIDDRHGEFEQYLSTALEIDADARRRMQDLLLN